MRGPLVVMIGLMAGGSVSLSACNVACGVNDDKLAALRRGMSYEQVSQVMGCGGELITAYGPATGDYAIVEWAGPLPLSNRTRLEFLNDKLMSYSTERRGANEAFTQPPP